MPGGGPTSAERATRDILAVFHRGDVLAPSSSRPRWAGSLWRWRSDGRLTLLDLTAEEVDRMAELMAKYKDRPMDLADASLVVAAERLVRNGSLLSTVIFISIVCPTELPWSWSPDKEFLKGLVDSPSSRIKAQPQAGRGLRASV